MNRSPSDAPGSVTLLTIITIRRTKSRGIINLLAFSIPLMPKKHMAVVIAINTKCQITGSLLLINMVKSAGAAKVVP